MNKPTMHDLLTRSTFTRAAFARYVGLSDETIRKMEEGIPVSRQSAEKALSAFNRILSTSYTLADVDVALID